MKIKNIIALLSFLVLAQRATAQQPDTYEEYAIVTSIVGMTMYTRVDYGDGAGPQHLIDSTNGNKKIKETVAALNYMGKQGWVIVAITGKPFGQAFTFKRIRRVEPTAAKATKASAQ